MEVQEITNHINVWMWHIQAIIFLVASIIMSEFNNIPWMISFIVAFIFSEFMSWKRRKDSD